MKITIIEDEKILASKTAIKLKRKGFSAEIYNSFYNFKNNYKYNSDLYLIDISLGDGSGFDIIKWLRQDKKINSPIIITSGYNDDEKKIYGLNIGADDYLAKPYSPEILLARIRALIRRSYKIDINSIIKYKNLIYDFLNKELKKNNIQIYLTYIETQLVEYLLFNVGKLVTKEELIISVWGEYDITQVTDNTIHVTISKIRKKLGSNFNFKTVIGKGYILNK